MKTEEKAAMEQAEELLRKLNAFVKGVEDSYLYNEQWYLDFEDELNRLSIKDHSV